MHSNRDDLKESSVVNSWTNLHGYEACIVDSRETTQNMYCKGANFLYYVRLHRQGCVSSFYKED